jgi:hypothetical protein
MAFFPVDRNANGARNVLASKSALVSALAEFDQLKAMSDEMTQAQIESYFGLEVGAITLAAWKTTVNGVVTALEAAAVENFISQLG